ncbi:MAG: phenylalanine--tRNA ligase subunit beta [Gammaproteobacteria bacterium]|nr:phenylalanine--tRNA ligase subunit beta [Gammaproteobacteria bacterium]
MQFSEQWLREWVNPPETSEELAEKITMAGLEVDSLSPVAGDFTGILVAEVVSTTQHPNADKLTLCEVSVGAPESLQIVCGAPNVRVGIKVPCAVVGAVLPGDFKIKRAKLRGVESFGMLCSEEELGLSESADGLMELPSEAPLGQDIRSYLQLDDSIIDVDLTPNRGDCLSMLGLAREVGLLTSSVVTIPEEKISPVAHGQAFPITVTEPQVCPRYVGRVITNIDNTAASPLWLVEKLRRGGVRSIDPIVDVTNYVLLELGQPMHAFSLDKLSGSLDVRLSNSGESLVLIDGREVKLDGETPLITDKNGPLAIAGVMGGAASAVSRETRDVFLECAYFNPASIAGQARKYGLHTDSSHRFERGVDYEIQIKAIERACELLSGIVGGDAGPLIEVASDAHLPQTNTITLRSSRAKRVLGFDIDEKEIEGILERLGLVFDKTSEGVWQVQTLSYRFDLCIEEDLIEELGRVHGYPRIPTKIPEMRLKPVLQSESVIPVSRIKRNLVEMGYQEAITYSFVDPSMHSLFAPSEDALKLLNPISSDLSEMRMTLWPGLVKALQHNYNRQHDRIRFFEVGTCFIPTDEGASEQQKISGVILGAKQEESWAGEAEPVDFFDIKGDVENLLGIADSHLACEYESSEHPALHPGQCAKITRNGDFVGILGALHPRLSKFLQLDGSIYLFELQLSQVSNGAVPVYSEISRYPRVRRDIALLLKETVPAGRVTAFIKGQACELLRDLNIFDVYSGKGVKDGYKSIAISLYLQHQERTLGEDEVAEYVSSVLEKLKQEFNAILRE